MNYGTWQAILLYLSYKNEEGKQLICKCSQCQGTYSYDRAYINEEGDFVLSQDTLQSLLEDYKYSTYFDMGHYIRDKKELSPDAGLYYRQYLDKQMKTGQEDWRVRNALVKKEYE